MEVDHKGLIGLQLKIAAVLLLGGVNGDSGHLRQIGRRRGRPHLLSVDGMRQQPLQHGPLLQLGVIGLSGDVQSRHSAVIDHRIYARIPKLGDVNGEELASPTVGTVIFSVRLLGNVAFNGVQQDDVFCPGVGVRLDIQAVGIQSALLHVDVRAVDTGTPPGKAHRHDVLAQRGQGADIDLVNIQVGSGVGKGRVVPLGVQIGKVDGIRSHGRAGEGVLAGIGVVRLAGPGLNVAQRLLIRLVGDGIAQVLHTPGQGLAPGIVAVKLDGMGVLIALCGIIAGVPAIPVIGIGGVICHPHPDHQKGSAAALIVAAGIGIQHPVSGGNRNAAQVRFHAGRQQVVIGAAPGVGNGAVGKGGLVGVGVQHVGLLGQSGLSTEPETGVAHLVFNKGKAFIEICGHLVLPAVEIGRGRVTHRDQFLAVISGIGLRLVLKAEHDVVVLFKGLLHHAHHPLCGLETEIDIISQIHNGLAGDQLRLHLGHTGGQVDSSSAGRGAAVFRNSDISACHDGHLLPAAVQIGQERHCLGFVHRGAVVIAGGIVIVGIGIDSGCIQIDCGDLHILSRHLLSVQSVEIVLHSDGDGLFPILHRPPGNSHPAADAVPDLRASALEQLVKGRIPGAPEGGITIVPLGGFAEAGDIVLDPALSVGVDIGPGVGVLVIVCVFQVIVPPVDVVRAVSIIVGVKFTGGIHQPLPDPELALHALVIPLICPVAVFIRPDGDGAPGAVGTDSVVIDVQNQPVRPDAPAVVIVIPFLHKGISGGQFGANSARRRHGRGDLIIHAGDRDGLAVMECKYLLCPLGERGIGVGGPDVGGLDRGAVSVIEQGGHRPAVRGLDIALGGILYAQHHAAVGIFRSVGDGHGIGLIALGRAGDIPADVEIVLRMVGQQVSGQAGRRVKVDVVLPRHAVVGGLGGGQNLGVGVHRRIDLVAGHGQHVALVRDHVDRCVKSVRDTLIEGVGIGGVNIHHSVGLHIAEGALNQHLAGSGEPFGVGNNDLIPHPAPGKLRAGIRVFRDGEGQLARLVTVPVQPDISGKHQLYRTRLILVFAGQGEVDLELLVGYLVRLGRKLQPVKSGGGAAAGALGEPADGDPLNGHAVYGDGLLLPGSHPPGCLAALKQPSGGGSQLAVCK